MSKKNTKQLNYSVEESNQFLKDIEEAALWILISNVDQAESLVERMLEEFEESLNTLKNLLKRFPKIGVEEEISGVRKFPIYRGKYSAKWIFIEDQKKLILITLVDLKYPKELRVFKLNEE